MTIEEAIEMLKQWNEDLSFFDDEKEGIECHCLAISALEKQIPKKPIFGYNEQDYICCHNCNYELEPMDAYGDYCDHYNYCPNCGQALDWSDEE